MSHISLSLQGFDEFMNLVVDEAEEIHFKTDTRKKIGKRQDIQFQ